MAKITLVLGGARSGKSAFAEKIVEEMGGGTYLATSRVWDAEMAERVQTHQDRRNHLWATIEEPVHITGLIADSDKPMLVDCLTLWLSNLMEEECDIDLETEKLCAALAAAKSDIVLVSNEVGLGIVPDNALARKFRDHAGRVNQAVAQVADHVVFIAAGLPLTLKE
ncbi:bifunctional adenosylcobinamide kinase/adenosylcobinamide-phosphate guanylyltransferase [Terasakiella sp. A23]|uniref:bifunctional adenosylcobinamide kinase/adenosylcobinamide-phosphate guanylyltransferase n=1 Tax=Terasakiella sp. FCG-A23 TaxID=3080561 RepID=UPI002952E679|nr:bifunctional adenosylcobinamide kinase/adenosylcobinamide-phosphate guanylyltransferase [Terasakiella sp. A23]MDV7339656.1 bifunctional adenosylcobinamide kinase/adenosylcobinamide-phosphate guanylyltransferase [Terasakiella sp. A23]